MLQWVASDGLGSRVLWSYSVRVLNTVRQIEKFGLFCDNSVAGAMSAVCTMRSVPPWTGLLLPDLSLETAAVQLASSTAPPTPRLPARNRRRLRFAL